MTQKGQRMKYRYYVFKGRIKGARSESTHIAGYKYRKTAERLAKKAAETWDYVEYGRYDTENQWPEYHPLGVFVDQEEKGGDELWDSLTQASLQVQEEVNLKVGDSQPEAKPVQ